jgi:hypothetical protein
MGEKTFQNIIIVILVLAIIYLLFKNNINSYFTNIKENITENNIKKVSFNEKSQEIVIDNNITDDIKSINSINSSDNDNICGYESLEDYEKLDEFVNEYKDIGRFTKNNITVEKGNEAEINSYRKSFLDFRNYTNNTSNEIDPVLNMNLEKNQNNSLNMNISDIYDKIVANNYKESNIDIVGMQHNEKVNDTIRTNEFYYDSDSVNNGAFFFDNVTGYDNKSLDYAL